jgi:hypothetical protein
MILKGLLLILFRKIILIVIFFNNIKTSLLIYLFIIYLFKEINFESNVKLYNIIIYLIIK